ncbi:hypothetical protein [Desulforamulus reducens]|uniref:hypothetical protein n=1 Tax=Desulforamulus reducens TaxID=59610 RepID=UPI00030A41C9|nr:hypothetical protein [Desulforamulus reducens]
MGLAVAGKLEVGKLEVGKLEVGKLEVGKLEVGMSCGPKQTNGGLTPPPKPGTLRGLTPRERTTKP